MYSIPYLGVDSMKNLYEQAKLIWITYSKCSSMTLQFGVQKFTPHSHIECTDQKVHL